MSTWPVSASWAMAATRPPALSKSGCMVLVRDKAVRLVVPQLVPALEECQLDQEGTGNDRAARLRHQPGAGLHRAAGRQHVVDQEHPAAVGDAVGVHVQLGLAVL